MSDWRWLLGCLSRYGGCSAQPDWVRLQGSSRTPAIRNKLPARFVQLGLLLKRAISPLPPLRLPVGGADDALHQTRPFNFLFSQTFDWRLVR